MKTPESYIKTIQKIVSEDPQFPADAYFFLQDAVSYTINSLNKDDGQSCSHISGQQLAEGLRKYLLKQFGVMAFDILQEWQITQTRDFGILVFNMVRHNILKARKEDSIEDFADVYDFHQEFVVRFLPENKDIKVPLIA